MPAKMVDSVVFVIKTKIVNSSAPNPKFYGNKRILKALCTVRLAIQAKIDDKAVICQVKYIMFVGSFSNIHCLIIYWFLYN